ncbi:MAG: hypothetical protein ACYSUR_15750 [Planctomycetota bacterium]
MLLGLKDELEYFNEQGCPLDNHLEMDGTGFADLVDLLIIMGNLHTTGPRDMTGNGIVGVDDVILLWIGLGS